MTIGNKNIKISTKKEEKTDKFIRIINAPFKLVLYKKVLKL